MKMITESNYDITTSINESKDGKKELFIQGIFASAEEQNLNGRTYPKPLLEREVHKILSKVNDGSLLGEMQHPTSRSEIDLNEACIKITELNWQGNHVYGKAKVLTHCPKGALLEGLLKDSVKLGISSRGLGTVSEAKIVNDDFNLLTWDVVSGPSNRSSFVNGILESVEFNTENKQDEIKFLKEELEKYKTDYNTLKEAVKNQYELDRLLNIINNL